MGSWADVGVDTYIVDANGSAWRVCAVDETAQTEGTTGAFRCKNAEGEWTDITPKPLGAPVNILEDPDPIALLRDQLGAEVIATQDHATKRWTSPPWPAQAPSRNLKQFRIHLDLSHGIFADDIKGYAKLLEVHNEAHEIDTGRGFPHVH